MPDSEPPIVQPCPMNNSPHWIEIELVGEDGNGIPWEQYKITLPDGTVSSGFLDDKGKARVDNIPLAGQCKVTFPDLDAAAWDWDTGATG
jgi:hypothetical protein